MKDERLNTLVDSAFNYWRNRGFPYLEIKPYELWEGFFKLEDTELKISKPQMHLFEDMQPSHLEINHIGISTANHFHPHIWASRAIGMRSPVDAFEDDKALRKTMRLAIEYNNSLSDNSIRNMLRKVNGTQMCSNFRPSAAKTIYQRYWQGGKYILDPSTGYGGRLLGFLSSGITAQYIGVDPNEDTCEGNEKLAAFFNHADDIRMICNAFEDISIKTLPMIDLAFTSPPYFHKEIYSDGEKQSSNRYKDYGLWLTGFWHVVLENVYQLLNNACYFVVNIQDVKIKKDTYPLIAHTIEHAQRIGFVLDERLEMSFSQFGKGLDKSKSEAILAFKKV